MTITMTKALTLCGVCALLTTAGNAAFAQNDFHHGPMDNGSMHYGSMHHGQMHHARAAIMRQKQDYARAVASGHYRAAERAHLRASMIRHHVRAHRQEMHRDHGY